MHAKHPEIAKEWDEKYGVSKDLPEKKGATALAKIAAQAYEKVKTKKHRRKKI